jgi:hypothetical protein
VSPWESVVLAFGGNAVLLAVLAGLARSLLGQVFAKDLEKFKSDLAAASAASTTRLTHELKLVAQEHQVLVSKLHEKRALVVAEVYGLLVEAQWACHDFASPMEFTGEPSKKEKYLTAMNKAADFYRYFDKNRIYLPADVCMQLEEFIRGMRSKVIGFGIFARIDDDQLVGRMLEQKQEAWIKASEYFQTEAPKARVALEVALRSIVEPTASRGT